MNTHPSAGHNPVQVLLVSTIAALAHRVLSDVLGDILEERKYDHRIRPFADEGVVGVVVGVVVVVVGVVVVGVVVVVVDVDVAVVVVGVAVDVDVVVGVVVVVVVVVCMFFILSVCG